jgi:hypothetical protein
LRHITRQEPAGRVVRLQHMEQPDRLPNAPSACGSSSLGAAGLLAIRVHDASC